MRVFYALTVLVLFTSSVAHAAEPQWLGFDDEERALAQAREESKPLFVHVYHPE